MKNIKNIMLAMLFVASGLHAGQQAIDAQQDQIANKMIQAMQECIEFHEDAQWKLLGIRTANNSLNNVMDNQSAWEKAVGLYHTYIGDLRAKYNEITRPGLTVLPEISKDADLQTRLMLQANQSQFLFTRLLDEYIAHFGQVYEKQGTLLNFYRTAYYISSRGNQSLAITPNQYPALMQILDKAMLQKDWSSSVDLKVIIAQENRGMIEKTLALHEIINALKLVPLPVQYSTAAKIAMGVGAAAVVGAGAYAAYQMYGAQPADVATDATPTPARDINALENEVAVISQEAQDLPLEPATSPRSMPTPNWIAGGDAENYGMPAGSSGEDELEIMNTLGNSTPVQAIVGHEAMTVPNWQGNSDAELYGAPGLSGEDLINATSLIGTGQLVGNLGKAATSKVMATTNSTAKTAAQANLNNAIQAEELAKRNAAYYNNNVWEKGGIKAKEMNQAAEQAAQNTQAARKALEAQEKATSFGAQLKNKFENLKSRLTPGGNMQGPLTQAQAEAQATAKAAQAELDAARNAQAVADKNAAYYNNNVWEKGGIKAKEMNTLAEQAAQRTQAAQDVQKTLALTPQRAQAELDAAIKAQAAAEKNAAYYNNNVWEKGGIKAKEMNTLAEQAAQRTQAAQNALIAATPAPINVNAGLYAAQSGVALGTAGLAQAARNNM